jgi:hypothetical protein
MCTKTRVRLHVSLFDLKIGMCTQIVGKVPKIGFREKLFSGSQVVTSKQTERQVIEGNRGNFATCNANALKRNVCRKF